ncbi:eCIS core domain-containing protein [Segetibacter aerophilus]|uniref:eCIS core domain-containing protein n=1 Tax=Segetibacter aerophilus TaxID=670293 RepID=A0A512BIY7_9BACT|nr:DUF4157 domain-containing protein [Segetibacter aerophilus]GEO11924.1 hypothetical protein SAE01_44200 [Segetibacter aerophilus]
MGFIGKTNSSLASKATPFSMADALPVQAKLTVSKASDPAEKEADTVASRVVDEQKEKRAHTKTADDKKDNAAKEPLTEPNVEPKKEGLKTKEDKDNKEVQKMGSRKEEKKAAKKDDDKQDKLTKKDDKKQEAKKASSEKEEKKVAKQDDGKKDKLAKKDDKKQEAKKASSQKEEKKVAKQDDGKKDKLAKKDDKKQEAKKKGNENEEKKAAKKDDDKQDKVAKKEENNKDKKPVDQEKDKSAKPKSLHRKDVPAPVIHQKPQEKPLATALGRKEGGKEGDTKQQDDPENDEAKLQAIEEKINAKKGSGRPLNDQLKADMEQSFKYDFSEVKIHDDKESAELCASLNAQAFAIGNDIFFNTGKYDPESDRGRELIAHELTHVVQQKDQVLRAIAYRNPTPSDGGGATDAGKIVGSQIVIPSIEVPQFKSRNTGKFGTSATRKKNYSRKAATGGKAQTEIWKKDPGIAAGVKTAVDGLKTKAGKKPSLPDVYFLKWKGIKLFGKEETLIENSKVPLWNASGEVSAFDVDHILELQLVGGENTIDNMELLNFSGNRSSGSQISNNVEKAVQNFITKTNQAFSVDDAMKDYEIKFEKVSFTGKTEKSSKGSGADGYWSFDQVQKGQHLKNFEKMTDREIEQVAGKEDNPIAYTSEGGGAMLRNDSLKRMPGFEGNINLSKSGAVAGTITGKFNPNPKIFEPLDNISINIYTMDGVDFGGFMKRRTRGGGNLETVLSNLKVKGMSPIELDSAEMLPDVGIVAKGRIQPSVEIIKDLYIDFSIEGKNVILSRTFSSGNIKGIPPPLKVTDASLIVFANGGTAAIGVTGKINFEINKVGKGEISATGDTNGVFKLMGNFEFDEKLFGGVKANVKASYEHTEGGEDKWDVNGNIKIPKGKIKGIDSAEINVNYADRIFKADGSAKFGIPGLEDGKMSVTYGNDQLLIEGEANFKHKFIKSGKVTAKVETAGEETKVSMSGNAKPNIPGIDSDLTVSYVDGVFTVSGTVGYTKGRLAGTATVGVTNQAVGADGKPSGGPGEDLKVFGGGSLTLKITDWLQGTAGVTFKPDGNIEVVGKIGIPAAVNIFEKKEIKKEIFKAPTIEIPLFAIPVGSRSIGLVATIGGGAEAYASIGPGQLTDAAVEVKYNPAEEESMSITGNAKFKVPAEAGLRVYVRAGIGLSVGIARVSGGIELGGALGIEGAAEAGVVVNWTPATGFKLDAEASLSVQPKFKFDVNAYVEAVLDLWVTEFSKEWKWNLYAFEWGPAMKFGVKFPVHYEENKPFEISLDDVKFEAPDISVSDFAKGIGQQLFG